ncbi:MAG: GGDEF and EAL domain-containing protein [Lachnospiraceae bacterium]|nr:GGDEF and EAL domain-containing protein [Lachnospiraceae bacterium]
MRVTIVDKLLMDFSEQFNAVIDVLTPCMDNYLYITDLKNDTYCISESAMGRFRIPSNFLMDATAAFQKVAYPGDYAALCEDLEKIRRKEKDFHNLQYRWMDKEGNPVWINCRGRVLLDGNGEPEFLVGCINEIGKKQKADNVSGLLGESALQEYFLDASIRREKGFLLRIGIDNFKEINENKGMSYGDMILRKTAEAIGKAIVSEQKLFKVVADEFVVVDFEETDADAALELYQRIQRKISAFIIENGYEVFYTISAGVVYFADIVNQNHDNLMKLSEFALNEAKDRGKNKCYIYQKTDYNAFQHKKELIHIMRQSVNNGFEGFTAYFQPVMDIKKNKLTGAETLLRFNTEKTGFVSPVEFIPLLEESGLIIPVGRWVLEQAMLACEKIQKIIPDFRVSVNLSYIQVLKSNVLKEIIDIAEKYQLPNDSILVELTESGFLESDENFIDFCQGLKEHGIPLALDDFGTGYSNFHYLYNISPNTIKIDRSFTLKALKNDYEYNLLRHMSDMTHSIDLNFCIEGIETKEELEKICGISPDYIQGYYFGKPCPFEQFMDDFITGKC